MTLRDELRADVLGFIRQAVEGRHQASEFDRLALRAFAYQYAENEPYRRYCERRGIAPDSVAGWADVPAVPTAAFKEAALVCGAVAEAEAVFRTSGTTQGVERRGVHYVRDLSLYRASALPNFEAHVLSDRARLRMLMLAPPPELAPDSSLTWMLEEVRRRFGTDASGWFVAEEGLRADELTATLGECEGRVEPLALLGTAAAFAHYLEALAEDRRAFRLAPGSRIMETGGFKRRGRDPSRDEFYGSLVERLGVSEHYCVAEYGMTEMCSQFYDNVLRDRARGRAPELRVKLGPPWVRTRVVDPEALRPLPDGRIGILRHFDLANLDSVAAIQTDDLGLAGGGGFEILGRATGAELRGCSIAMEEWLTAQR